MATLAALAAVMIVTRWTVKGAASFLAGVYALGAVRHYYAPILVWITIATFPLASSLAPRRRLAAWAGLVVSSGLVLQMLTGTFLSWNMRNETVVRYVTSAPAASSTGLTSEGSFSRVGETSGRVAPPRDVWDVAGFFRSLEFVLFGRFVARAGVGRVLEAWLFAEWVANFFLLPLAIAGTAVALKRGHLSVLVVAGFISGVVLLLAWTHGDDWTTYRFRAIYWPLLLVLSAGGAVAVFNYWRRWAPSKEPVLSSGLVSH
jgi:hypothetical protein